MMNFNKERLAEEGFALNREWLLANSSGTWASSSIANCHSRKYHGLLVVPQPQLGEHPYVMLSSLDEVIVDGENTAQISSHLYPGKIYPSGYELLESFSYGNTCEWLIRGHSILLSKELLLLPDENCVLIRYTILESSNNSVNISFTPLLACRSIHTVTRAVEPDNMDLQELPSGIGIRMHPGQSTVYLQFSKKASWQRTGEWYFRNEYEEERKRGYDYQEDLYSPGRFNVMLKSGEQLVFSAALKKHDARRLKSLFQSESAKSFPLNDMSECLEHAARQFLQKQNGGMEIIAGYYWFGRWGRDTFISLPGLTLSRGDYDSFRAVLKSMLRELKEGLFPNVGYGKNAVYNSADAPLWFFWCLQQYASHIGNNPAKVWEEYGKKMKLILKAYQTGTLNGICMQEDGLIKAGDPGTAVTWMDAMVDGNPVIQRHGLAVELNALWYNAVCFSIECAGAAHDREFTHEWKSIAEHIPNAFINSFWNEEKGYLADVVNESGTDWSFRPNQVFAASLPYSALSQEMKISMLTEIENKLLTPRGLRTLSPDDNNYKGVYRGDQRERDQAYHQGTVWPWLLGHFVEAKLRVYGTEALPFVEFIYEGFKSALSEYGIGSIAELYDGDAPHQAGGAISQAWSVAELLRIRELITHYKRTAQKERMEIIQII